MPAPDRSSFDSVRARQVSLYERWYQAFDNVPGITATGMHTHEARRHFIP
jgi:hypothetical protein